MKLFCFIPNYNDSENLIKSVNAVLNQEIYAMEVLIVDDASTDQSWEVIKKLPKKDSRIKIAKNDQNVGVVKTFLEGLKQAQGEFIYMGSSNDFVLPGFFKKAISTLERFPEAGFFCGNGWLNHQGTKTLSHLGWGKQERLFTPENLLDFSRKKICTFHGQSVVLRRSYLPTLESVHDNLKGSFDLFIFFSIAMRHGFYYSPEALSLISINNHNFSGREKTMAQKLKKTESYLNNLSSSYFSDVKKRMIQSGLLSFLGIPLLYLILQKRNWEYCSWNLFKDILPLFFKKIINRLKLFS